MHHIYHTHGFVLSSINKGEANKMLTIYTKEMGLIRAMSQGIRLNKSKLRFALQDFCYAKVDFVRGKDIWRVTSATIITSFPLARTAKPSILLIARVSSLIERLCDGEEANPKIFDDIIQSFYLLDDGDLTTASGEALELYLILRIMNFLGYIGESDMFEKYLSSNFNHNQIEALLSDRHHIISHINKALNESQL